MKEQKGSKELIKESLVIEENNYFSYWKPFIFETSQLPEYKGKIIIEEIPDPSGMKDREQKSTVHLKITHNSSEKMLSFWMDVTDAGHKKKKEPDQT